MKTYRVVLMGTAIVEQVQLVEAESAAAAMEKARTLVNDNVWEYQGLTEDEVGTSVHPPL